MKALHKSGNDHDHNFKILNAVIDINDAQKTILIPKIKDFYKEGLSGKTFGVWGLAFKPETDDIREAPALYMIEELLSLGAKVKVFDPEAMPNVKKKFGDKLDYCSDKYQAASNADALIICTEWSIFRLPNFDKLKKQLKAPVIFDGRNLYDVNEMENEGFYYTSIGRKMTTI